MWLQLLLSGSVFGSALPVAGADMGAQFSPPPTPATPSFAPEARTAHGGQLSSTPSINQHPASMVGSAMDLYLDVARLVVWLKDELKPEIARLLKIPSCLSLQASTLIDTVSREPSQVGSAHSSREVTFYR